MQTGSGVYHEEETVGDHTEFFQIWFAPYLQEALGREPTYAQYQHEDFPIGNMDGYAVKTIIGHGAPVAIEAEAKMCDIQIDEEHEYSGNIRSRSASPMVFWFWPAVLESRPPVKQLKKKFIPVVIHCSLETQNGI